MNKKISKNQKSSKPPSLSKFDDDQLVNELVSRGWTLRHSTTGRYTRCVMEDCNSEFLKGN